MFQKNRRFKQEIGEHFFLLKIFIFCSILAKYEPLPGMRMGELPGLNIGW